MSKGHHKAKPRSPSTGPPDGAVYVGLLMIGSFGVWMWTILGGQWQHAVVGYTIAIAVLINLYTWRVLNGKRLLGWQQSLARLPLRWVGFGTRGGKPLEAAHGSDRAKIMLFLSIATCAVIVAGLTVWLIPM